MSVEKPFLALCMIVRDAADTLPALLDSVLSTKDGFLADEYVFVDTGSVDQTRELLLKRFGMDAWPAEGGVVSGFYGEAHITLHSFKWTDDFAAARNFAFSMSTAKWRMYLDADDVFPNAHRLMPSIRNTEKVSPQSNCVSLGYTYVENAMQQDVVRVVRWEDGWIWEGALHEHMVRVRNGLPGVGGRVLSKYTDLNVVHKRTSAGTANSLQRNLRICQAQRSAAIAAGDMPKIALYGKYIAEYLVEDGQYEMAERLFRESFSAAPNTNLSCYARVALCRMMIQQQRLDEALILAGETIAFAPELREGVATAALIQTMRGEHVRAVDLYDQLARMPGSEFETVQDQTYMLGLVKIHAILSYVACQRLVEAQREWNQIPPGVAAQPELAQFTAKANVTLMRSIGVKRLTDMLEFYIWSCEPIKAQALLAQYVPATLEELPAIALYRRQLQAKLPHLDGFDGYCKAYASIPEKDFHTADTHKDSVLLLGRHVALLDYVRNMDSNGANINWLSIGFQDGLVEAAALRINPRLILTVCDVGPQASQGYDALVKEFGDRVARHEITSDEYDWSPLLPGTYDMISMFEVIEHVPDEYRAFSMLKLLMRQGGKLFMSTPVSDHWIEPYLTGQRGPPFFGHVRGFSPTKLHDLLCVFGFTGDIYATENGSIFIAEMTKAAIDGDQLSSKIAIYVPHTPLPFDADAHRFSHVGGSEEAVIHLAAALSRYYIVEVYCPRPVRSDGKTLHARGNVLWRDSEEFDFGSDEFDSVLFWRCPAISLREDVKNAKYKKLLWAHDTHYGAPPIAYEKFDAVICLSETHSQILREEADDKAPIKIAANGVDVPNLPELPEKRIPHSVIYASSPDRGLANLLALWPAVIAAVPDAVLNIYYTWDLVQDPKVLALRDVAAKLQGVTVHGGVAHHELHVAYGNAEVWCYPVDSFREISCISAMKSLCMGCTPVAYAVGALQETLSRGGAAAYARETHLEQLASVVVSALLHPPSDEERKERANKARSVFDWKVVAERFAEIIDCS